MRRSLAKLARYVPIPSSSLESGARTSVQVECETGTRPARLDFEELFPPLVADHGVYPKAAPAVAQEPSPSNGTRPARCDRFELAREAFLAVNACQGVSRAEALSRPVWKTAERIAATNVEGALKALKVWSSDRRLDWVMGRAGTQAAQESFLGRALPVGTQDVVEQNLKQHQTDLLNTEKFKTDPEILTRARTFACRWSTRHCPKADRSFPTDLPRPSSCSESRVRDGGLRGLVNRMEVELPEELVKSIKNPTTVDQDLLTDMSRFAKGLSLLKDAPGQRASAVRERGLKARIVTSSAAAYQILGHPVRKRLMRGLKRTKSAQSTLLGMDNQLVINHLLGASAEIVVSTDLTRATDLLPLELVSAVIDGLEDSGRFPAWEVRILRLLTGPQEISYPDGTKIVSDRGILMGLPVTWALLSLVHTFWWDTAIREEALARNVHPSTAFALNKFTTCGDDGLFAGWKSVAERFKVLVRECGGSASAGKHFESSGPLRAVFVERLYTFTASEGLISSGRVLNVVPVRGLVRPEVPLDILKEYPLARVPNGLKFAVAIDQLVAANPNVVPVLRSFVDRRTPWLDKQLHELGLLPGGPLALGGWCLGTPTPQARRKLDEAWIFSSTGKTFVSLVKMIIDPVWKTATLMEEEDLRYYQKAGWTQVVGPTETPPVSRQAGGKEIPFRDFGSFPAATLSNIAASYATLEPFMAQPGRVSHVKWKTLARRIQDWRKLCEVYGPLSREVPLNLREPSKDSRIFCSPEPGAVGGSMPRWSPAADSCNAHRRNLWMASLVAGHLSDSSGGAPGPKR